VSTRADNTGLNPGTGLGPDLPLNAIPAKAVSVQFVVEHRSALNGHTVRLHGVITAALLGDAACPPGQGLCAQPSVFLVDAQSGKAAHTQPVRILMPQDAKAADYPVGKAVELQVSVQGSKNGVVLSKKD
jgi:hypothetical protein